MRSGILDFTSLKIQCNINKFPCKCPVQTCFNYITSSNNKIKWVTPPDQKPRLITNKVW